MTNEQILKKAIEKAVKNGWDYEIKPIEDKITHLDYVKELPSKKELEEWWNEYEEADGWRYHQHKMLDEIQEGRNPLKYLEKFL